MAEKRDYYEVLGLQKGASADEIKKAYRKCAKENHPDLHPGDAACEQRFKEANEAYEVLSDPDKRAKYDQFGFAAFDPSGFQSSAEGFGGFASTTSSAAVSAALAVLAAASAAARGATAPVRVRTSAAALPSALRRRPLAAARSWMC